LVEALFLVVSSVWVILAVLMLVMVLLTLGILSKSTNLNTSTINKILEWLMACRVMVDTEGDILGSAAIDDMDAIPDDLITDGDITNASLLLSRYETLWF
jgi:hypothetical protein